MNRDTVSSVTEDGHQAIYSSLPQLPDPPRDLPKPLDFRVWQRWFLVSIFAAFFITLGLGQLFKIEVLDFGMACVSSWTVFLFLGIILITLFNNRGIRENYTSSANPAIARSLKKYQKKKPAEAYFSFFVKYLIDNQDYYFVWYVPGIGSTSTRSLARGAEPLLFNKEGKPLDDPELFSKVFLMWSYGLNISPGTLQYKLIKDRKVLKKLRDQYFPPLLELLELNSSLIENIGLSAELQLVKTNFPAKDALFLHSIDILDKKIAWADSHGWDSVTQLRYQDFITYHTANVQVVKSRRHLMEQYRLGESEGAAHEISMGIQSHSSQWINRKQLIDSLEAFSAPLPAGEINFKKGKNDLWVPPEEVMQAFRSRLEYVRTIEE